ncbi:MAG: hypothetical protein KBS57_00915, partial [Alistipes sp.]|nr:hypothetical protein [Candidatus Minthomonas equi]
IEVVNDTYGDAPGLTASVKYLDIHGRELDSRAYPVDSKDDSTLKLCDFQAPQGVDIYYLKLTLSKGNEIIAENFYWEGSRTGVWSAIPKVDDKNLKTSFTTGAGYLTATVTNESDVVLPMIRVNLNSRKGKKGEFTQVLPAFFEDNYFALLPGESRTIKIEYLPGEHADETFKVTAHYLR